MLPGLILLVLTGILSSAYAETSSWPVAVSDLTGKGVSQPEADLITDRLRGELVKTEHFAVMEREQMGEILKEQGFQQSGACSEQSCVVAMGQMLGVRYMVSGTVGSVGKMIILGLKVIDVSTGQIVLTVSEDCECSIEDVLSKSTGNVALKLDNALYRAYHAEVIIETQPSGAMVFLNGTMYGQTPFSNQSFSEGVYRLKVSKAGYVSAVDSFSAAKGKTVKKTITLEMTKELADSLHAIKVKDSLRVVAVQDSIKRAAKRAQTRKKIIRESIIALVAGAFAGGGFALNSSAQQTEDQKTGLVKQYRASSDQTEMNLLKQQIQTKQNSITMLSTIRNVLYGVAGAGGVVFLITIPF